MHLLRLERSFTDSKDLGDFLRRERVIRDPAPAGNKAFMLVLVAVLGLAAGYALNALLR